MGYRMSFTFKLRKAPATICSLTIVSATLAPSTPVLANTQTQSTAQAQSAVVAQDDLSAVTQGEGDATPQAALPQKRFLDVPESSPFYNEIMWLFNRKITIGYADSTFHPKDYIERSGIAVYFYRLAGSPYVNLPEKSPFKDVSPDDMWYKEMVWFSQQGITTGWPDGTFRPHDLVDRNSMAAFFYRFAGSPQFTVPQSSPFWDVRANEPFYKEIVWLRSTGITTGWSDGTFRPYEPISREAMAAFIYRYAHLKR